MYGKNILFEMIKISSLGDDMLLQLGQFLVS